MCACVRRPSTKIPQRRPSPREGQGQTRSDKPVTPHLGRGVIHPERCGRRPKRRHAVGQEAANQSRQDIIAAVRDGKAWRPVIVDQGTPLTVGDHGVGAFRHHHCAQATRGGAGSGQFIGFGHRNGKQARKFTAMGDDHRQRRDERGKATAPVRTVRASASNTMRSAAAKTVSTWSIKPAPAPGPMRPASNRRAADKALKLSAFLGYKPRRRAGPKHKSAKPPAAPPN